MKKLVALALLLLLQTSTPAFAAQTQIQIEPVWPVYCAKHDYPIVNAVSEIRKIEETERTATFTFRTVIGACNRGSFLLRSAIDERAIAATFRNKIVLFERHNPVISRLEVLSGAEAQVTLTFDKSVVFKKKNRSNFTMMFYPQGYTMPELRTDAWGRRFWYQPPYLYFPWEIHLSQTDDGCHLAINVQQ